MSRFALPALAILLVAFETGCVSSAPEWQVVATTGDAVARHEASFVSHRGKHYLLGGRGTKPVAIFDPASGQWTQGAIPPLEIHHFQAVSFGEAIYIVGAMTGGYPDERPLPRILRYLPDEDRFEWTHSIPGARRRGGAGAAVHDGAIYLVGGIVNGHRSGSTAWADRYDPESGDWRVLPDAPDARDHAQAVVIDGTLWTFGGRRTSLDTNEVLSLTTRHGNRFNLTTEQWSVDDSMALPTLRAGNAVAAWGPWVVIAGGESATQQLAHSEVEAYHTVLKRWQTWPSLQRGRHGTGLVEHGDALCIAAGSGERGGSPELSDIECFEPQPVSISSIQAPAIDVYQQWHTVALDLTGPMTDEQATPNPFTDFRLDVVLSKGDTKYHVRGFYAADGQAADTGARSGDQWRVYFRPGEIGTWSYQMTLKRGDGAAWAAAITESVVAERSGQFEVIASDKSAPDFRATGPVRVVDGHFDVAGQRWWKVGANSPENLLAYRDFDDTYRQRTQARDGEASTGASIHRFAAHKGDWQPGDPTWGDDRGREMIGAMNYLASVGMNSSYFLTLNIGGDGDDVWPYATYDDRHRFDISKLAQWERVFAHMQSLGIALHVVLQETENERLLDDGDTGVDRQLYLLELIARFGHHPGLIWNLGEENGPASFSPNGQTTGQRIAMAEFIGANDPYDHPVLIHTHADAHGQNDILTPLLGYPAIDGISLQVNDPQRVSADVQRWKKASANAGKTWIVSMDEIGPWQTGAPPDQETAIHKELVSHVLWGALMHGADGVEWYFGAHYPHNDLNAEDWRTRDTLWQRTAYAVLVLKRAKLLSRTSCAAIPENAIACLQGTGERILFVGGANSVIIDDSPNHTLRVLWIDAVARRIEGLDVISEPENGVHELQAPTCTEDQCDWVMVIRAAD
ncbi:MAG: DUF5060 domain-containing protein [Pseudomonadota bacterium]